MEFQITRVKEKTQHDSRKKNQISYKGFRLLKSHNGNPETTIDTHKKRKSNPNNTKDDHQKRTKEEGKKKDLQKQTENN